MYVIQINLVQTNAIISFSRSILSKKNLLKLSATSSSRVDKGRIPYQSTGPYLTNNGEQKQACQSSCSHPSDLLHAQSFSLLGLFVQRVLGLRLNEKNVRRPTSYFVFSLHLRADLLTLPEPRPMSQSCARLFQLVST